jgi:hypothetical protein
MSIAPTGELNSNNVSVSKRNVFIVEPKALLFL